jgi:hypothetical protein
VTVGAGGSGGTPPCPDLDEALDYLPSRQIGCEWVSGFEPSDPGECCYEVTYDCGVGRPYTDGGETRSATPQWGTESSWSRGGTADACGLSAEARRELAEAWCADGMYEHASVASFARFAMELMAVGAPAELVEAAHHAAADEVRHARACLALASTYAGRPVSPGAFPFEGRADVSSDLAEIAARAAYEGCVGETVAAIQAAEQLNVATDPHVRDVLGSIAEEEARHAELAWRTVAWAIGRGGEPVRNAVAGALRAAMDHLLESRPEGPLATSPSAELSAHGRLDAARIMAVRAQAIREVVAPCAARLMRGEATRTPRPRA